MKIIKIIGVLLGSVLLTGTVLAAGINASIGAQQYMTKAGVNIVSIVSTYELGSTTRRWAKGWFTDLDVSGIFTFGGVMGSNLDMDGYNIIMDTDADSALVNDRDATILDDQIGWQLATVLEGIFTATDIRPATDDAWALGVTNTNEISDLFLNTGAVIGFENNDLALTHSSNTLTMTGGNFVLTQPVINAATPTALTVTGGAHTAITAATEDVGINFDMDATKTWAAGAGPLANQRETYFRGPTYVGDVAGALVITDAATVYVDPPIQGANMTLTNIWALQLAGRLGVPAGTAALPSISFPSDSNTGFYSSAANTIGFANNGLAAMTLGTNATFGYLLTLTGSSATTLLNFGTVEGNRYPRTWITGGVTAGGATPDFNYGVVFAHRDATAGDIPMFLMLANRNNTDFTTTDTMVIGSTATFAVMSTITGASSDGLPLYIGTDGSEFTTGTTQSLQIATTATGQGVTILPTAIAGGAAAFTVTPAAHTTVIAETIDFTVGAHTMTTTGAITTERFTNFGIPTITSAAALTTTTAATVAISATPNPTGAGPQTITNAFGLMLGTALATVPAYSASNATTIDRAAMLYIAGAPVTGGNVTVTAGYALWVDAGNTRLDGTILQGVTTSTGAAYLIEQSVSATTSWLARSTNTSTTGQHLFQMLNDGAKDIQFGIYGSLHANGAWARNNGFIFTTNDLLFSTDDNVANGGTHSIKFGTGGYDLSAQVRVEINSAGKMIFTPGVVSGGSGTLLITPAAHTTVIAEVIDNSFAAHTMTTTGAITTQRFTAFGIPTITSASALTTTTAATVAISATPNPTGAGPQTITNAFGLMLGTALATVPAYSASAATTIDSAAMLYIAGAPATGGNVTVTNGYAIWSDGGNNRFDGDILSNAKLALNTQQAATVDAATTFAATSSYILLACTGAESIDTITGGITGMVLMIENSDADCTVVDDESPTAANAIDLTGAANDVGATAKVITLIYNGTSWLQTAESDN